MTRETFTVNRKTYEINFVNLTNPDGSLSDIKYVIKETSASNGAYHEFELIDFKTRTVAYIDNAEQVIDDDIDQVTFTRFKELAMVKIMDNPENQKLEYDLGGYFV